MFDLKTPTPASFCIKLNQLMMLLLSSQLHDQLRLQSMKGERCLLQKGEPVKIFQDLNLLEIFNIGNNHVIE